MVIKYFISIVNSVISDFEKGMDQDYKFKLKWNIKNVIGTYIHEDKFFKMITAYL